MRKLHVISLAAVLFMGGALFTSRAEAMTLPAPSGLAAAVTESSMAEEVAYYCRRVWRCGYWGCGWRRVCSWAPGPYYYRGYYRPYPYYGYRYWGWRRRYWY
ncbi:MAG TPA: hypothetical protein VHD14_04550 [Pseudolabrys sp.]|jgi:hypothetical protein|nr:hypothetical protein [Pseudolabrys sp.]